MKESNTDGKRKRTRGGKPGGGRGRVLENGLAGTAQTSGDHWHRDVFVLAATWVLFDTPQSHNRKAP